MFDEFNERSIDPETETCGIGVVGGLAHVDVVVGVDDAVVAFGFAEVFECKVSDDLVGVHVEAGAGSALEDVNGELIHATSFVQDLVAGPDNGFAFFGGQGVQSTVGQCRCFFDLNHAADEFGNVVNGGSGNVEVVDGAQGVDAVVSVVGYFHGA